PFVVEAQELRDLGERLDRLLVAPDDVLVPCVFELERPVRGVALEWARRRVLGAHEKLHANVAARDVVARRKAALAEHTRTSGLGNDHTVDFDAHRDDRFTDRDAVGIGARRRHGLTVSTGRSGAPGQGLDVAAAGSRPASLPGDGRRPAAAAARRIAATPNASTPAITPPHAATAAIAATASSTTTIRRRVTGPSASKR